MAVMTIDQVRQARQAAYDKLKREGYDPGLQITSKAQLIEVAKDMYDGMYQQERGAVNLHVHDGTGGMFVALLERIKDDALRAEIIKEVNQDDPTPGRHRSDNRYPGKITTGDVSLLVLRSWCTTQDIKTLGNIASGRTKYTDPRSLPDFMKTPAARGLYLGSLYAGQ